MNIYDYFGEWMRFIDLPELSKVIHKLNALYKEKLLTPAYADVFKAFLLCKVSDLKIVIIGQDPYPQKNVANGLAFGNKIETTTLSPSLQIIKNSIYTGEGVFDITMESWAKQGILLLNNGLTCELNKPQSHVMLWRPFMVKLLKNLSEWETGLVYILFGAQAQTLEPYINKKFNYVLKEKHPAYYARTGEDMPNTVFLEAARILKENNNISVKWCN